MADSPARLERTGALDGRDRIWAAIRALGSQLAAPLPTFSIAEVAVLSGQGAELIYDYFLGLSKAQPPFIECVCKDRPRGGRGKRDLFLWRLVRDVGVDAPRVTEGGKAITLGQGNQLLWDTMRRLKDFDVVELAAAASTKECTVTRQGAVNLLHVLVSAGYVEKTKENKPAIRGRPGTATFARYAFVRAHNTGPRAPSVTKERALYDNNLGRIVYTPPPRAKKAPE